mmetsp:Transcript_58456/g.112806  ORF Transcript_58456/g.112806 Transcript_58456/m.112806 type:complete len:233 (-) Transcript_58456:613-1311(-)
MRSQRPLLSHRLLVLLPVLSGFSWCSSAQHRPPSDLPLWPLAPSPHFLTGSFRLRSQYPLPSDPLPVLLPLPSGYSPLWRPVSSWPTFVSRRRPFGSPSYYPALPCRSLFAWHHCFSDWLVPSHLWSVCWSLSSVRLRSHHPALTCCLLVLWLSLSGFPSLSGPHSASWSLDCFHSWCPAPSCPLFAMCPLLSGCPCPPHHAISSWFAQASALAQVLEEDQALVVPVPLNRW